MILKPVLLPGFSEQNAYVTAYSLSLKCWPSVGLTNNFNSNVCNTVCNCRIILKS